nr:extracellular solute-binding protein [Paenibacillus sp. GSMTC-2017]
MNRYPQIKIHLTNDVKKVGNYATISELSAQGSGSDIMLLNNSMVIPLAVKGYLKPVDSLMSGDVFSDQLASLLEPIKWNGYLWGTPDDINPYVIAWNKDMLAEEGLTEAPDNWNSLQELAEKLALSEPDVKRHLVNFSPGDLPQLLMWATRFNGERSTLINLLELSPNQAEQLTWLQSRQGAVVSIPLEKKIQLSELIVNHQLLTLILPWEELISLKEDAQKKLIVDNEALYYPWLDGSSYVISSSSKYEDEAMLWIQEMTDTQGALKDFVLSNQLPVRASLYDNQIMGEKAPPSWWLDSMNAKLPEGELLLADPNWLDRWTEWELAWEMATKEEVKLDVFVEKMTLR